MELAKGENHQSSVTYGILQQTMELSKPDMWWTALGAYRSSGGNLRTYIPKIQIFRNKDMWG